MTASFLRLPKLRFPPEREAAYRRSVAPRIVQVMRIGLAAGIVAIPAFVGNDLLFDKDALTTTGPVRLFIAGLLACGLASFFVPRIKTDPAMIALVTALLYFAYAVALVLIQTSHPEGVLVNVPGYVQVMIFIPIVCFSFAQALGLLAGLSGVAISGALLSGAGDTAVMNLVNWMAGGAAFALGAAFVVDATRRRSYLLEQELSEEKARADALLLNILPAKIAERLKNHEERIADYCPNVTVLFADIAGFTEFSRDLRPQDLVELLNDLFLRFDRLAEVHEVEKIKTIGDGYMAVAGLSKTRDAKAAARAAADLALDMRAGFRRFRQERGLDLDIRIGLHSGPVVAGVIGARKFAFDLWGDTVNLASRIESCCAPGQIQITSETAELIAPGYETEALGEIDIRGHEKRKVFRLLSQRG